METIRIPLRYKKQLDRLTPKDRLWFFDSIFLLASGGNVELLDTNAGDILELVWRDSLQMAKKNVKFNSNAIGIIVAGYPHTEVKGSEGKGSEKKTMCEKDLESFDLFRKKYLGTKNGNETEFNNFKKKHKDWKTILPLLESIITKQIKSREQLKLRKEFIPSWKNLSTWINQRCWEEEITIVEAPKRMSVFDKAKQYE